MQACSAGVEVVALPFPTPAIRFFGFEYPKKGVFEMSKSTSKSASNRKFPEKKQHQLKGRPDRARVCIAGTRYDLGRWDSPEAEQKHNEYLADWARSGFNPIVFREIRGKTSHAGTSISLAELCQKFLKHAEFRWGTKHKTFAGYRQAISEIPMSDLTKPVTDFNAHRLHAVLKLMCARTKKNGDYMVRKTINARLSALKAIFDWGLQELLVPTEICTEHCRVKPIKEGDTPARESKEVMDVDMRHVEATLTECSRIIGAIIRLLYHTGARTGEILIMRSSDIDRSGKIWIYRPPYYKTLYVDKKKGKKGRREIYLNAKAQRILQPFLECKGYSDYLFSPRDAFAEHNAERAANRKTEYKSPSRIKRDEKRAKSPCSHLREHYTYDSFANAVDRATERYNKKATANGQETIPLWNLHQIRHARAVFIDTYLDGDAAQIMMGHAKPDMTQNYAKKKTEKGIRTTLMLESIDTWDG